MSNRLVKSTAIIGANTLLSRILGFVRDVVIARLIGASVGADAFFVAFRIPNFLRRLFAEGAFSQAFVPILSEYKTTRSQDEVEDLIAHVSGMLVVVLFLVTLIGVLAAPIVIAVFAPGFIDQGEKYQLAVDMVRITFPYILFISLTALAGGILNTYGRFNVPAFTPVLLNLSLISAALWLSPLFDKPVVALAWGVLFAGIAQLLFQLPFLHQLGLLRRPRLRRSHTGVTRVLKLIVPAIFGVSVAQINLLIDTLIASFLVTGSVSWLYYSDRMVEFPLGVFGLALATVILPSLSQDHAAGSPVAFSNTIDWALRCVLVLACPAAIGLALLASPILTTLFQYGAFSAHDVHMASLSLTAYALGLVGFIGVKVLAPGYYARQDVRTPVRIGVVAMVSNIVLNLLLVGPLSHTGLALATSLSAFINAGLLFAGLRKKGIFIPCPGWGPFAVKLLAANLALVGFLWVSTGHADTWTVATVGVRALTLGVLVGGGALVYAAVLLIVGVRPREFVSPTGK